MTYFPDKSVMWTNVSLNEAKMCATPKTFSPSATLKNNPSKIYFVKVSMNSYSQFKKEDVCNITWGPRETTSASLTTFPLRGAIL